LTRESELPPEVERVVLTVRMLTYWNSHRIAAEFRRRQIWPLSHAQMDRLFARLGTHRSSARRVPGPRYERERANDLWHIDLKVRSTSAAQAAHGVATSSRWSMTSAASSSASARCRRRRPCRSCALSDNGTPFVAIVRTMLSRFQRSLADLQVRHIRTQIDTPWTNGKVEAFWATLQAEVLDRQDIADLAAAERAVTAYAGYYNYHRLHGELGWHTPAERFDGTPFTDRGFENIPALTGVSELLSELLAAA